jgi:hypothetical protein
MALISFGRLPPPHGLPPRARIDPQYNKSQRGSIRAHSKIVAHVRDGHPRRFELAQGTSVFHPTSVISVHRDEPTMLKVPSWMAQLAAT